MLLKPDSALAALLAATILPLPNGDAGRATSRASMIAIFAGLLCVLAGLARIGFATEIVTEFLDNKLHVRRFNIEKSSTADNGE